MAIILIHNGYSPYLELSLRQARAADPGADIVLLGDGANDRFPFIRHVDTTGERFQNAVREIGEVYRHRSTNSRSFELLCFQRWFLLREFMEGEGLADALVLDSDVMLYATEAEIRANRLAGKELALCRPAEQEGFRWMASPHASYWTAESIRRFEEFLLQSFTEPALVSTYSEKWDHHLREGLFGGICDMTSLYLFSESMPPSQTVNMSSVVDDAVHDQNVNTPENEFQDEYRMRGGIKEITFDEAGRPWGYNVRLERPVRFETVHFQGKAKEFMPHHYRGPRFAGDALVRRSLAGHYRARRVASVFVQPARLLARRLGFN